MRLTNNNMRLSITKEQWIALVLCLAVFVTGVFKKLLLTRTVSAQPMAPDWLPLIAAGFAVAGIMQLSGRLQWFRPRRMLIWAGLLLLVWTANGIPFDILTLTGLMADPATSGQQAVFDWPGMVNRMVALAATVVLARLTISPPAKSESTLPATWYGYAAFILALPYPFIRTIWAFGGMTGLSQPGAGGVGFIPWLAGVPWIIAAALSLLLVSVRTWKPRRFLIVSGWTATIIVAMLAPTAVWSMISQIVTHRLNPIPGMAMWVPCLFYCSWFLWFIAAYATTRSYQLRSIKNNHLGTNEVINN